MKMVANNNSGFNATPSETPKKQFDVYITYRDENKNWVVNELLPQLKRARIKTFAEIYTPVSMNSRLVLEKFFPVNFTVILVLSKSSILNNTFEEMLIQLTGSSQKIIPPEITIIPLLIDKISKEKIVEEWYSNLLYFDFSSYRRLSGKEQLDLWDKLFKAIRSARKTQKEKNDFQLKIDNGTSKASNSNVAIAPAPTDAAKQDNDLLLVNNQKLQTSTSEEVIEITSRALSDIFSKEDLLGYQDYVDALADFIESNETQMPLVIGIDAPWGGGKTSLMHMLEKRIGPQPIPGKRHFWQKKINESFHTIWFNAWKYDQEESLWAALVLEILNQVRKQMPIGRRFKISFSLNWKRFDLSAFFADLGKSLLFALGLTTIGVSAFCAVAWILGETWIEAVGWFRHYIKVFAGFGLISILYTGFKDVAGMLVSPFNLGITKYLKMPKYKEKIGFLGQFQTDYKDVINAVTFSGKWPIIIFIDDLDRCTPIKAVAIIEAINLLLDSQNCVFILGIDARVMASSIQAKYKDFQEIYYEVNSLSGLNLGRKFLEKIIQIDFHIPRPDPDHVYNFIDANLGRSPSEPEESATINPAESILMAEQRSGKSLEDARKAVEQSRPELTDQLSDAVEAIKERSFDDDPAVYQTVREMAPYLDYNPRKIKRFINLFRLQALIAYRRGILGDIIHLDILGKWVLISMRWPEFIDHVVNDSRIIAQLWMDIGKIDAVKGGEIKNKIIEGLITGKKYSPIVIGLLSNNDFRELLPEIHGQVGEAKNYLGLASLFNSPLNG